MTVPQRIGLISSAVPLVSGGYRLIVEGLEEKLRERGHLVETIYLPSSDEPEMLLTQMAAFRMIELDNHFDRVVTFRPPAHMVRHQRKVCWFIHHVRVLYDLWDKPDYHRIPDNAQYRAIRDAVRAADTVALEGAYRLFTNSRVVADRLRCFNGLSAEVLYPPVSQAGLFTAGPYGDEIVCICRMEGHKRQHLLIEAMRFTRSRVRLRLCGLSSSAAYHDALRSLIARHDLSERVVLEHRWITEEEKAAYLRSSLAAAYVPFDEDSYGYPTLEAAYACRCTLTVLDSGGVVEFVEDGRNGLIAAPTPEAVAAAFDLLYENRPATRSMGEAAERRVTELGISWDTVIARLLA